MQILESAAVTAAMDAIDNRTQDSNCLVLNASDASSCDGSNTSECMEEAFHALSRRLAGVSKDKQPTTIYYSWRDDCTIVYYIGTEAEVITRLGAL